MVVTGCENESFRNASSFPDSFVNHSFSFIPEVLLGTICYLSLYRIGGKLTGSSGLVKLIIYGIISLLSLAVCTQISDNLFRIQTFLVCLAVLSLSGLICIKTRRERRMREIPGPPGLPFVGHALILNRNFSHHQLATWAKEYGDVYRIKVFGQHIVVLSGYDVIHEVLVRKTTDFAGRPELFRINYRNHFKEEFSFCDFSSRLAQRKKLIMSAMRMTGNGLSQLESISYDVIDDVIDRWRKRLDEAFDPQWDLTEAVGNIVCSIVFGRRLEKSEISILLKFLRRSGQLVNPTGRGLILDVFPILRIFPNSVMRELSVIRTDLKILMQDLIDRRKRDFDAAHIECVLDTLLIHCQDSELTDEDENPLVTIDGLYVMVQDLLTAGTSTTTHALYALLAIMCTHSDIQRRIQAEIDSVLGACRPRCQHRKMMPYTEATILELLRYTSHVPTLIPHKAICDSSIGHYDIPKGTQVWVNAWALHHDERHMDDPWRFDPLRFLDDAGNLLPPDHQTRKRSLPFGAGRRVCLGEALARNRMFLIVSSLLQKFYFEGGDARVLTASDPNFYKSAIVIRPDNYKLIIRMRETL